MGVPAAFADHAKLMFDLQILAFQADITRVVTFQLTREQSNRTYPEIGVADPHHPTSHHGGDPEKLAKIKTVPDSLQGALAALEKDHEFLLRGDVFTKDLLDTYIDYKKKKEIDYVRLRPHPAEFQLYFDA